MVNITNGVDEIKFSTYNPAMMSLGSMAEIRELPCIRINEMFIKEIDEQEKEDYVILENVFNRWLRFNYPPFWKNPIRYLFGGRKCYNWSKFFDK